MEKYYTPSIEEFHEGFEYEFRTRDEMETEFLPQTYTWVKEIYSAEEFCAVEDPYECTIGFYLKECLDPDSIDIRVKYLDKEDIESLGFEYKETDGCGYDIFTITEEVGFDTGANITIKHNPRNIGTAIKVETYGSWACPTNEIQFKIKNKSEFKKLLDQLGINYDTGKRN